MIEKIEIRIIKLPLVEHFETSFGRIYEREILLISVFSDGIIAFSESATDKDPLYSYENNATALHILEEYIIPLLFADKIEDPINFKRNCSFIKGHNMAKSAMELALWDLKAKKMGQPLYKIWGGVKNGVISGVSIGIKDSLDELNGIIEKRLEEGYQRIKLKIKPGKDTIILSSMRKMHAGICLSVDCNAAYGIEHAPLFKEMDAYKLLMIEQPLAHDDVYYHSVLQGDIATDICLDESITGMHKASEAIELGSCRVINIKIGRVGGYIEAKEIHDYCASRRIPVWCGGMLESGIGRAFNVALATLPDFTLPNDISETRRYWSKDIIDHEFIIRKGLIEVPQGVGIGVIPDFDFIESIAIYRKNYHH
ncbi:MAG: o-succinylbenzoate synthase [Candidatus Fischerbacteria bacterium RBG_13_37_8]|uniref:o-succinylbenzoate synthase n=1 Tax=Candidatus Fischerbacteria bacterium RBG_13_37_8 TaxID=1817863 RepID=A0A1F5VVX5_9BACT|nr:MAG: o-succinylbenzoate synthase [Candidatus Fischerbacteria bacterium RBG_13_37_8]